MIRFSSLSINSQRWYELVKVTINALDFAEVIFDVVKRHHDLPDSVATDRGSASNLVIAVLFSMHQTQSFYRVPSADQRPYRKAE